MSVIVQDSFYIGNNFNAIIYVLTRTTWLGIELTVWFLTIRTLTRPGRKPSSSHKFLMVFSTVLLVLNTVFVGTQAGFGEHMWILDVPYPGGADQYLTDYASVWYQTLGTAASILLNLLSDGLLIYRCYVIWADKRVVMFPMIMWLTTFGCGIAQLVASGVPHSDYFSGVAQKLGTSYTSVTIALEIIVTALIWYRIRRLARRTDSSVARAYTSVSAIFVESAALTTVCGVPYLITFSMGDYTSIAFLSIYVMSTCLAPQLVILRIVSGRGWTQKTTEAMLTTVPEPHLARSGTMTSVSTIVDDTATLDKSVGVDYSATAAEKV
ncbi:hypothetical protein OH77DRAFT_1548346 [Trametes cingulata]|nr:hypothetical protein OH77DRAFT_1548346 [Trametes cingulata]